MKSVKKSVKVTDKIIHESRCKNPFDTLRAYLAKNFLKVRRCDAVRALEKMGVATHTARTQYQRWYASHDDKNRLIETKGVKVTKGAKGAKGRKVTRKVTRKVKVTKPATVTVAHGAVAV